MRQFDDSSDSATSILSPRLVRKINCLSDDTDDEFSVKNRKKPNFGTNSPERPTVPHVSARSENILSSCLNRAISLLSSESDHEYVTLRRRKFLPKIGQKLDKRPKFESRPKVPMVSAKSKHILDGKMDQEINSLSSESDSEEEYTLEKVSFVFTQGCFWQVCFSKFRF